MLVQPLCCSSHYQRIGATLLYMLYLPLSVNLAGCLSAIFNHVILVSNLFSTHIMWVKHFQMILTSWPVPDPYLLTCDPRCPGRTAASRCLSKFVYYIHHYLSKLLYEKLQIYQIKWSMNTVMIMVHNRTKLWRC